MLATIAINAVAWLSSCELEYYQEELYRKEISFVSGENNVIGQEFEYGGDEGLLALYASGTTPLEEDVTVKVAFDKEAIGNYNRVNFDTQFDSYAQQLPDENFKIKNMEVVMKAGENTAFLPVEVDVDNLLVDQTYFIPLRIESVSAYMPSLTRNYVLFEVYRKNEFATTKDDTYYTMNGTSQEGWLTDNVFGSAARRQVINSSKLVVPCGENSILILPAAKVSSDKRASRNMGIKVTVSPNEWVDVPVYVEGVLTDKFEQMRKVTIEPYLDSVDALQVRTSPVDVSGYDPKTQTFHLYYRYKLATENSWYDVRETMVKTQY